MRRVLTSLGLGLTLLTAGLVGCGGGEKTGDIVDSPEAIAADEAGQKAVMEYMQNKNQSPAK